MLTSFESISNFLSQISFDYLDFSDILQINFDIQLGAIVNAIRSAGSDAWLAFWAAG